MNLKDDVVIGIVSGMGPKAGLALCNSMLNHTNAAIDQEHISTIMMSFPRHIGDRTSFLQGELDDNPAFSIVEVIKKLEQAGANLVGIACNTSHAPAIYRVITSELAKVNSRLKLVNMPMETCRYIKQHHGHVSRVGIMATNGTYRSGVYQNLLAGWGFNVILPDWEFQNEVIHTMIYDTRFGIKANPRHLTPQARMLLDKALLFFKDRQAEAVILGCTDLSYFLTANTVMDMLIVDSTEALARALIREATHYRITKRNHEAYLTGLPWEV